MKSIPFAIFLLFLAKTCNAPKKNSALNKETFQEINQTKHTPPGQSTNVSFKIHELYGEAITNQQPTLYFEPEKKVISGNSGCNSYSAGFSKEGENYSFEYPMATKIFCEGDVENNFFKALREIVNLQQENNMLIAKNVAGAIILKGKAIEK